MTPEVSGRTASPATPATGVVADASNTGALHTGAADAGAGSRRTSGDSPRRTGARVAGLIVAGIVLVFVAVASLAIGNRAIDPMTVLHALTAYDDANPLHLMVQQLRLPRTILGIAVGAALAVCGALIQAFTRNPLADPGILGVNAGASFAVTFAVGVLGLTTPGSYVPFALGGAFVLTVLVYALGSFGQSGATPMKLTLAGVALGAAFTGFTTAIVLQNHSTLDIMRFWGVGSIGGRSLEQLAWALPLIAAGLVLGMVSARSLNALALGDDLAQSLGARIRVTRIVVIVAVTLLAGTSVAAAGPIAFVGIMIPHMVRWFTGPDQRWVIGYSIVIGPIFLLLADILGRVVLPNSELRVGIVTGLLGAPVLIALVRRKQVSGL